MSRIISIAMAACLALLNAGMLGASNDYPDHKQLSDRLQKLSRANSRTTSLKTLGKTHGGKDIWLLTIGSEGSGIKPAIAILGGVEGDQLLGTELALRFAESILSSDQSASTRELLSNVTFYIFPDVNPDAREQYFSPLRYERQGNGAPSDWDRDGLIAEDPFNDLNGDGLITLLRVKDPSGEWIPHPEDDRIMIKADPGKGQRGEYILLTEGIDDDKDGKFNEDTGQGVVFNRNFTFGYMPFTAGAGEHAVSEIESRAIADFLFNAKNVFAVVSFSMANNLSEPMRFNERNASGRIPTAWQEQDIAINQMVSHHYRASVDLPGQTAQEGQGGDFFQWAYFHYGRYSFSTPAWWIPPQENTESQAIRRTGSQQERNAGLDFLKWAEKQGLQDVFIPWTRVEHPDFPDKIAEVGGIKPFLMKNPPFGMVDDIAEKHTRFLLDIASMAPRIRITELRSEKLGNNLFRLTAIIENTGEFPTNSQMGNRVRWVQKPVIRLLTAGSQSMISGSRVEVTEKIDGGQKLERSWLIQGKGQVTVKAGSESAGFSEKSLGL